MTSPRIERRLAAILAADVAGYSRLMGADEVGTLTTLKAHRRERIDPAIARHNGRIVKTTGDGLLVEFASVVDAVGCAVAIQRAMLAFNAGIHADRQIVLRIGINVGDIILDGGDIFGDGVNVAARLEALCEPGGVCISRYANEQVRDKLSLAFADLGEQTVKNIARAVGVFGLAAKDIAALPEEALPQPEPNRIARSAGARIPPPCWSYDRRRDRRVAILAASGWWTLHGRTAPPVAAVVAPVHRVLSLTPRKTDANRSSCCHSRTVAVTPLRTVSLRPSRATCRTSSPEVRFRSFQLRLPRLTGTRLSTASDRTRSQCALCADGPRTPPGRSADRGCNSL